MNNANLESQSPLDLISQIVATANGNRETTKLVKGWDRHVYLCVDGQPIGLVFSQGLGKVIEHADPESGIRFTLSKSTLIDLMNENCSPLTAKLTGRIQSSGNMIDILRFASILSATVRCLR